MFRILYVSMFHYRMNFTPGYALIGGVWLQWQMQDLMITGASFSSHWDALMNSTTNIQFLQRSYFIVIVPVVVTLYSLSICGILHHLYVRLLNSFSVVFLAPGHRRYSI